MAMSSDSIHELVDTTLNFVADLMRITQKQSITQSDIDELREMMKKNPKDYFPNLKD